MRIANPDEERQYLQRWDRLGPLLDAARHAELRRMTNEDYLCAIEQLWSVNVEPSRRDSSGLVEWQRLLRK